MYKEQDIYFHSYGHIYILLHMSFYKLYKNFKWKKSKTKVYKKTYVAKYRYKHENGNKYLALYTKSGKFVGYINTKAAKVVK